MSVLRTLLPGIRNDELMELRKSFGQIGKVLTECTWTLVKSKAGPKVVSVLFAIGAQVTESESVPRFGSEFRMVLKRPSSVADVSFPSVTTIEFRTCCLADLYVFCDHMRVRGKRVTIAVCESTDPSLPQAAETVGVGSTIVDSVTNRSDLRSITNERRQTEPGAMLTDDAARNGGALECAFAYALAPFAFETAQSMSMSYIDMLEADYDLEAAAIAKGTMEMELCDSETAAERESSTPPALHADRMTSSGLMASLGKQCDVQTVEESHHRHAADIEALAEQLAAARAETDRVRVLHETCERDCSALRDTLEIANGRVAELELSRVELRFELSAAQRRIDEWTNELAENESAARIEKDQEAQVRAALEESLELAKERLLNAEQERDSLRGRLNEADAALHNQTARMEELEAALNIAKDQEAEVRAALEEASERLLNAEQERDSLHGRLNKAEAALRDQTAQTEQMEAAQSIAKDYQMKIRAALEERLEQANERLLNAEQERDSLRARLNKAEAALGDQTAQTEQLEAALSIAKGETKLASVESERATSRIELEKANAQIEQVQAQKAALDVSRGAAIALLETENRKLSEAGCFDHRHLDNTTNQYQTQQNDRENFELNYAAPQPQTSFSPRNCAPAVVQSACAESQRFSPKHGDYNFASPYSASANAIERDALFESSSRSNAHLQNGDENYQQPMTKTVMRDVNVNVNTIARARHAQALALSAKCIAPIPGAFKRGLTQVNASPNGHTRKVRIVRKHRYGLNKRQKLDEPLHPEMRESKEQTFEEPSFL